MVTFVTLLMVALCEVQFITSRYNVMPLFLVLPSLISPTSGSSFWYLWFSYIPFRFSMMTTLPDPAYFDTVTWKLIFSACLDCSCSCSCSNPRRTSCCSYHVSRTPLGNFGSIYFKGLMENYLNYHFSFFGSYFKSN